MREAVIAVFIQAVIIAGFIGYESVNRQDNLQKCDELIRTEYESKSPEYKNGLSKLPFEVLYYYNYGRMEYCLHHGKLLD